MMKIQVYLESGLGSDNCWRFEVKQIKFPIRITALCHITISSWQFYAYAEGLCQIVAGIELT
jgi:hypothetical protein